MPGINHCAALLACGTLAAIKIMCLKKELRRPFQNGTKPLLNVEKNSPRLQQEQAWKCENVSSWAGNVKSLSFAVSQGKNKKEQGEFLFKKKKKSHTKKHRVVAISLLLFSTCSFYFYGTAWLRRSAPEVWRQRGRTRSNGWQMRSLAGPEFCRIDPKTPELLS